MWRELLVGKGHVDGSDFILRESWRDFRGGETNKARHMCGKQTGREETRGSGSWEEGAVVV